MRTKAGFVVAFFHPGDDWRGSLEVQHRDSSGTLVSSRIVSEEAYGWLELVPSGDHLALLWGAEDALQLQPLSLAGTPAGPVRRLVESSAAASRGQPGHWLFQASASTSGVWVTHPGPEEQITLVRIDLDTLRITSKAWRLPPRHHIGTLVRDGDGVVVITSSEQGHVALRARCPE